MAGKLFLSVLLLVVVACPHPTKAQSIENATIEREEYAVYSAVIAVYVYEEKGTFMIANPTVTRSEMIKLEHFRFLSIDFKALQISSSPPAPPLAQETLDDFSSRNKSNRWLTPKFEMNRNYVLVDYRLIKKLTSDFDVMDQDWKSLFKEYSASRGFVTLSRVGFSGQMDQALVHIGFSCPGLCGHWSYLLLAKKHGVWTVTGEANRMVS